MNTAQYLDLARDRSQLPSDYALAKRLGMSRQRLSNWRVGGNVPDTLEAVRLAELCELDPFTVIADLERERAERGHREEAASAWRDILQKIGGVAAGLAVVAGLSAPSPAQAGVDAPKLGRAVYYVN